MQTCSMFCVKHIIGKLPFYALKPWYEFWFLNPRVTQTVTWTTVCGCIYFTITKYTPTHGYYIVYSVIAKYLFLVECFLPTNVCTVH